MMTIDDISNIRMWDPTRNLFIENFKATEVRLGETKMWPAAQYVELTSDSSISAVADGGIYTVTFNTNRLNDWTLVTSDNWITSTAYSGSTPGEHTVNITIVAQPPIDSVSIPARNGTVTITCGEGSATISIEQEERLATDIELSWIENTNRGATFTTALNSSNTNWYEAKLQLKETYYTYSTPLIGSAGYIASKTRDWSYHTTYTWMNTGVSGILCGGGANNSTKRLCCIKGSGYYNISSSMYGTDYFYNYYFVNSTPDTSTAYTINRATDTITINNTSTTGIAVSDLTDIYASNSTSSELVPWEIFSTNTSVARFKFYYLKTWTNASKTTLAHHYVPVRHWNGSAYVVCIKDKVTDTYIYQTGSGELTYG